MTAIDILLGVILITGGLLLGVALAFVVAGWINQPPIGKQHLAQSSGEETLASQAIGNDGIATSGYDEEGS